ncbi:LysR family transcriptional regulator [Stenotrophomonas sp. YAU14A_MKIMI4_1]|uniref:LysR family transcriptional regulator n=1 Tax=Stenotrophomonas sp. YAU14A_MKIMI4_1 TaxID=2072408 RepID=UPI000D53D6B8|nr:LysR family transcriptional regulator [Stenotrophomonas sp. YAU14A_MKIMI4_1]AWH29325.1 LysR family transcriptional regulator [Stenotrophomonas sp. YAU14A_MKIMI4_1]
MIEDLGELRTFDRIVHGGSLSAAARDLGVSLAVVSKRLSALERRLQVRLLNRSTRRVSLTDEGSLFHQHCRQVLQAVEAAEAALAQRQDLVAGVLRVTAPNGFGRRHVVPAVRRFQMAHPGVRVHLSLRDEIVDLVGEGIELALRYDTLDDSRLVARQLAPNRRVLCASPDYLQRRGMPRSIADLQQHDCIASGSPPVSHWRFGQGDAALALPLQASTLCDDGEAAHLMALQGAGIARKSIWDVAEDLQAGRLVEVLPDHALATSPLSAVHGSGKQLAPRVRVFLDHLLQHLRSTVAWRYANAD